MSMLPQPNHYVINQMPEQIGAHQLATLRELDTGTVGHFLESGFMDTGIHPRVAGAKAAGTAITVRVTVPDSVMAHYILKFARKDDILVIDRGQDQYTTNWGGATIRAAARLGLAAVIVDGSANDIADAVEVGLPIWSRHISPVTTKYRGMGGEMNVPVHCGGAAVCPGDAILADANGVVVIPRVDLDRTLEGSGQWLEAERAFLTRLAREPDLCYPDVTGATEIVEAALRRQQAAVGPVG